MDKESRLLTSKEMVEARTRATFANYYWNKEGATTAELCVAQAQDVKSVKARDLEIADRLEKMLKYSPVRTMAIRRELGNFIQALKRGVDEGQERMASGTS